MTLLVIWPVLLTWQWYHEHKLQYKSKYNLCVCVCEKFWLKKMQILDCAAFPNLPFIWSVFREEEENNFCWPGDLVHCNMRLAAALKSTKPIHRKLEVQHLDSSQQACHPCLPVLSGDIHLLWFSKGSPCLWDGS